MSRSAPRASRLAEPPPLPPALAQVRDQRRNILYGKCRLAARGRIMFVDIGEVRGGMLADGMLGAVLRQQIKRSKIVVLK